MLRYIPESTRGADVKYGKLYECITLFDKYLSTMSFLRALKKSLIYYSVQETMLKNVM